MRDSVHKAFPSFSAQFEGNVTWMYLDNRGLVTIGKGNLIDPIGTALALPFLRPDGSPASHDEIATTWHAVKALEHVEARPGVLWTDMGGGAFARLTQLRLAPAAVADLVDRKLLANEGVERLLYPEWEQWPADAQLGVLSMAWAAGAHAAFPRFCAAARRQDWSVCAGECHMDDTHNPGLTPRNAANVRLFQNAARVQAFRLNPEVLYWPGDATVLCETTAR